MSFEDNMICGRSSGPASVRPIQLGMPRTAGAPASALASCDSVLEAQRLSHDSSQPPDVPKDYRELSPDSVFPHDGGRAGSLQTRLYDAGSPVFEPPIHQHQYVEEEVPEENGFSVTLEETRINPPRVTHSESNEQAINAQERPIQSMIRHYCGDSEETQVRALELILQHHGEICRIERRKRAGASSGGVQSLVCLLCPPTSEDQTVHFQKTNAVRTFAEHFTHKHLHIPNPFVCFAGTCGKVFPYSQDRDRHEKQIHKMYRPKAYQILLRNRAREQSGLPPVHMDNSQSPTEFIEYVGPAEVNPNRPAIPGAHHSILPSSKRLTAHRRSPKIKSGAIVRSKTPVPTHRAEPYMHSHARSRPSTPHPSREGDRNVSRSLPFNNGIHHAMRETNNHGQPIMTGPGSHMFRAPSPQSSTSFGGIHASVVGVMDSYHATGGTRTRMSHARYAAPTAMPQPGSNMVSNPSLIDSTMSSSTGYQDPSTSVRAFAPSLQLGNHPAMGRVSEQPKQGPTYSGSMHSDMQNRMPPFSTHTLYQQDNYGSYGSIQHQPSHQGYVGSTMYQPQGSLPNGFPLYGSLHQNASTSSFSWPAPQPSTTAMSYTTPHPGQMPGHGASACTTYPPSRGTHATNPDELNNQFYQDSLRTSVPNSGPQYATHGEAGTSQYNQLYANTNNSSQPW